MINFLNIAKLIITPNYGFLLCYRIKECVSIMEEALWAEYAVAVIFVTEKMTDFVTVWRS